MFYGVLQEDYILQEIDFKGAIDTVKKKVKNAILSFIRKIENFLSKGKDNKIKSALRSLLQKVRKLLGDTENIETEADAKKINKEIEKYREEYNKITEWEAPGFVDSKIITNWIREMRPLLDNPSKYHAIVIYKRECNEDKLSDSDKAILKSLNIGDNEICVIIREKEHPSKIKFKKNIIVEDIDSNLEAHLIEEDGWVTVSVT